MDEKLKSPAVLSVTAEHHQALIATLTLAFAEDPIMRYLYPEPSVYLATMPAFVAAFCGPAFDGGLCLSTEGFLGAACWVRPGGAAAEFPPELFQAVDGERLQEVTETLTAVAGYHPAEPYW